MSDELIFSSTSEAFQHLANLTGKQIKIANFEDKNRDFMVNLHDIRDLIGAILKEIKDKPNLWKNEGPNIKKLIAESSKFEWIIEKAYNEMNKEIHKDGGGIRQMGVKKFQEYL